MEIFVLLMLYYLSQNPDFLSRIQPLMGEMKNSQELLKFIGDLSRFTSIFAQNGQKHEEKSPSGKERAPDNEPSEKEQTKTPASQTNGIANDFIQQCLENYFKKR